MAERRLVSPRMPWLVLLVASALVLLTGCGGAPTEFRGAVLDDPYVVPATPLIDTDGRPYSLVDDTDKPLTLVFFGFTHCDTICQDTMASLAVARTKLDPADRDRLDVVFVTTDPARDSPAALRVWLDRFDPTFIGLTGDLATIEAIGKDLAVTVEQGEPLADGDYEVVHGTHVTGIDASDHAPVVWTQGTSAAQFAADIHQLLTEGT